MNIQEQKILTESNLNRLIQAMQIHDIALITSDRDELKNLPKYKNWRYKKSITQFYNEFNDERLKYVWNNNMVFKEKYEQLLLQKLQIIKPQVKEKISITDSRMCKYIREVVKKEISFMIREWDNKYTGGHYV